MTENQKEELALFFKAMHQELYTLAYIRLQDAFLAEDAVQRAFEIACFKPDQLLSSPKPKGWLVKTLIHVIHQMQRNKHNDLILFEENQKSNGPLFDDPAEHMDLDILYGDLVDTKEYQLMKDIALENKSYQEAAKEARITRDAYKKRVERARKFLKEKINQEKINVD